MTIDDVRKKYLGFFSDSVRKHVVIPSASLVPDNDPTTLFTGSGMQPMLPYLLGQVHPAGKRIVDSQKCFRTQDIEEVGDNRHTTFFEMLGNWSFGDYWKLEQLSWIYEFLTKELGISKEKLWVSCFAGDDRFGLPKDEESAEIWRKIGMPEKHICFYDSKKNWWSRAGVPENMPMGEPGGPDSEIFYDFGVERGLHEKSEWKNEKCHPNCDCGRFLEIGNSVFMEYRKTADGFEKLPQKNVDFGGGLERITAAVNNEPDIFRLDVFVQMFESLPSAWRNGVTPKLQQIILDHFRATAFLISDGVLPSNKGDGHFLRRLLRRVLSQLKIHQSGSFALGDTLPEGVTEDASKVFTCIENYYQSLYPRVCMKEIMRVLVIEWSKFENMFRKGREEIRKMPMVNAKNAFYLANSFGLSYEIIQDLAGQKSSGLTQDGFEQEMRKHQEVSRVGAEKKFKGGLADTSEASVKYHTATHLLHQALRDVLGSEVGQKGSNITPERLRFDFAFPRKMTDEEKKRVEEIVNEKIKADLPVHKITLPLAEAKKSGALHFFDEKYSDDVLIHYIGDSLETAYSKEFCGGPHVSNTGALGVFKITKEEAVSAGVRRIKAVLN